MEGTTYGSLEDTKVRLNKISVLSIIVGLSHYIEQGAKAKPLKQPKAQHKEYDEHQVSNIFRYFYCLSLCRLTWQIFRRRKGKLYVRWCWTKEKWKEQNKMLHKGGIIRKSR
ncbi:hypothetical protein C5167_013669 [Papaver somniferum]|uniref:Uncharacterized protein n=1 Tax=Papaver somniferum TaxID=3469 RepID=A0A4Y7J0Z9_PAPSO|nr:hypothetical protein C5167_013669 [Papaver somniferum]